MVNRIFFQWDARHHTVVVLLFRSHTGFTHRTGASVEVVLARCHNCSSKLCLLFSPFEPRSLQQIWLHKNHNCGTVAGCHGLKWSSLELVYCREVKPRGCTSFSKAIQVCIGEALLFLIVDLTFHGQWHILPVVRRPPCSGSFACLGSHPSLANSHGCDC